MGLIKSWIREMGDIWGGMAQGDPNAFMGIPQSKGTGTGHATPDGAVLTARQKQMLMRFFHQQYGRYPLTDFEFQQWLNDNW